ncbi:MAG: hypothetical protein ACKVOA_05980 [Methylophilaceae bacterium]
MPFQFLSRLFAKTPNAAIAYKQAGGMAQHAFWLFAAPVHMQLGRESYFLTNPAPMMVPRVDAESIMSSLNQHFFELGYHFYLQNDAWFLGLDADPKIITIPIEKVTNQDVAPYLPRGEGALAWASLQNEIQMLLFSQTVNVVRESKGLPIINSLWCYGLAAS